MNPLFETARDLQTFLDLRHWRFCFIGGLAVLRWGEPRLTGDLDVTLFCGFATEAHAKAFLTGGYWPGVSNAEALALRTRVLLVQTQGGFPIDVALGGSPFEEAMVQRSSVFEFVPGAFLRTCSAEDLIVMKVFASRALDLRDAETVVLRHRATLDWPYIERNLQPLSDLKEEPEIMNTLAKLKRL